MDETFVIVGPDGTEHEFPTGMDPKKAAEIVKAQYPSAQTPDTSLSGRFTEGLQTAAAAPDKDEIPLAFLGRMASNVPASLGQAVVDTGQGLAGLARLAWQAGQAPVQALHGERPDIIETVSAIPGAIAERYASRYGSPGARRQTVSEDPIGMVGDMAALVGAGRGVKAGVKAGAKGAVNLADKAILRTEQFMAAHPSGTFAAGAIPGIVAGNPALAIAGAAGGRAAIPTILSKVLKTMRKGGGNGGATTAASAPEAAMTATRAGKVIEPLPLDAMTRGGKLPSPDPLAQLRQEIDWRTVDAVPIDAMKRAHGQPGGSILEAGESQLGLGERAAAAAKAGDAAEVERLLRALRQRLHIRGQ